MKLTVPTRSAASNRLQHVRAGQVGQPGQQPVEQRALVRLDARPAVPGDAGARRGQRVHADGVGRPRLVPLRHGGPGHAEPVAVVEHLPGGAAARQVGRRGLQPVGPADQRARTERGVELVPGEHHVVDVERGDVDPPVRGELRGVQHDARAVPSGDRGQFGDRPELTGDVGRAGEHDQARPDRAVGQRRGQRATGLRSSVSGVLILVTCGPRHGSSAAWCSVSNSTTDVALGSDLASRFSESVVLRVNTTASDRCAADEGAQHVAGLLVDPRRHLRGEPGAAVHAGVPGQQLVDRVLDRLKARRAGRVVEVGVGHPAAVQQRHGQDGTDHGGHGGVDRNGERHDKPPQAGRDPRGSPRLPDRTARRARSSPGAPHRGWRVAGQRAGA